MKTAHRERELEVAMREESFRQVLYTWSQVDCKADSTTKYPSLVIELEFMFLVLFVSFLAFLFVYCLNFSFN